MWRLGSSRNPFPVRPFACLARWCRLAGGKHGLGHITGASAERGSVDHGVTLECGLESGAVAHGAALERGLKIAVQRVRWATVRR